MQHIEQVSLLRIGLNSSSSTFYRKNYEIRIKCIYLHRLSAFIIIIFIWDARDSFVVENGRQKNLLAFFVLFYFIRIFSIIYIKTSSNVNNWTTVSIINGRGLTWKRVLFIVIYCFIVNNNVKHRQLLLWWCCYLFENCIYICEPGAIQ